MKKTKQHTVPSSYLKWFWDKPNWRKTELFVLNIKNWNINLTFSWDVTIEKDFYTIFLKNWEKDYLIEDFFSNTIEKTIHKIIDKINKRETLTNQEKIDLSEFIAFQEMRSIKRREIDSPQEWSFLKLVIRSIFENLEKHIERKDSLKKFLKSYYNYSATENELEEFISKANNWEEIIFEPRIHNIRIMLELAPRMAKIIRMRQWIFIHSSKERPFIVSDYPIYLHPLWDGKWIRSSPGYGTTEYIWFPISKTCYMILWNMIWIHQIPSHQDIQNLWMIKMFNLQTAYWTSKSLIWCNDKLLKRINKDIINYNSIYRAKNSSN